MKALIIKDFMVLNRAMKLLMVVLPISIIISVGVNYLFSLAIGLTCVNSIIAYDEQSKWNEMSAMMPYSKFDLVVSKYMVGYIWMGVTVIVGGIGKFVAETMFSKPHNIYNSPDMMIMQLSVILILMSVIAWTQLKYGSQKSRMINMISVIIVYVMVGMIWSDPESNVELLSNVSEFLPTGLFILAIMCNIISIMCSLKIKSK